MPVLLVAAAAAIGLAGCTAATPPATPSSAAAPSFPAVQGTTLSTSGDGLEWHRVVRVQDSDTAYGQARQLLVDGGFTLTKDRQGTGGGDGQACTPKLCVGFSATDGTDAGPILEYDWLRPTGVVG